MRQRGVGGQARRGLIEPVTIMRDGASFHRDLCGPQGRLWASSWSSEARHEGKELRHLHTISCQQPAERGPEHQGGVRILQHFLRPGRIREVVWVVSGRRSSQHLRVSGDNQDVGLGQEEDGR